MKYKYSALDQKNLKWFRNDVTVATLLSVELRVGKIRSLTPFSMKFNYPISAIAGKNTTGKSTSLAIIACAFHNKKRGFKLKTRKNPYYTFSDFFIQSSEEIVPEGIIIWYEILHNDWKPSKNLPKGVGNGFQNRWKRKGGKWNDYSTRVDRNVVFFGVERVVPHYEKSVSRSYKRAFLPGSSQGWEHDVAKIVGKILNINYTNLFYKEHSKYHLPVVSTSKYTYSGFNMGAGENALFEIFTTIFSCPPGV